MTGDEANSESLMDHSDTVFTRGLTVHQALGVRFVFGHTLQFALYLNIG